MERALAIAPTASYLSDLGTFLFAKNRMTEAESSFRRAVATEPRSVAAHVALAQFLVAADRGNEAEASFKTAIALEPASRIANTFLADFYLRSGRAAEAEPFLKSLADHEGGDPTASLRLADFYVGQKRTDDATGPAAAVECPAGMPGRWPRPESPSSCWILASARTRTG